MAYQPKKSKSYKYNLESVLKVRKIRELQQKEVLSRAEKKLLEELKRENEIVAAQQIQRNALRKDYTGEIGNFQQVLLRQHHLEKLKIDKDKQEKVRLEAENKRDKEKEMLVEAVKRKKIMEKDREKKKNLWKRFMNKEENKFIDEIATVRSTHNKL
jgi:flagellar protein FliJ